jgi:hypothetical protein
MNETKRERLQVVLAAYGADAARWPEADRRELAGTDHALPGTNSAREVDAVLAMASRPTNEARSLAEVLRRIEAGAPDGGNVVLLRPRSRPAISRWLTAIPLAASLVVGVYAGASGTLDSFLPATLIGETLAAGEDPGDLSGVSDAEALTEEDVT